MGKVIEFNSGKKVKRPASAKPASQKATGKNEYVNKNEYINLDSIDQEELFQQVQKQTYMLFSAELMYADDPTWRSFSVPSTVSLQTLAHVVMTVFGWTGYHLWQFTKGKTIYCMDADDKQFGIPESLFSEMFGAKPSTNKSGVVEASSVTVSEIFKRKGSHVEFTYDFGDSWTVKITLIESKISHRAYPFSQPIVCLDGEGMNPPEDIGGIEMYNSLCAAIKDPKYPGREDLLELLEDEDAIAFSDPSFFENMGPNEIFAQETFDEVEAAIRSLKKDELVELCREYVVESMVLSTEIILMHRRLRDLIETDDH